NPDGGCDEFLNSFAHATANYTLCTINHARPIHVCESCIDSYLEVLQTYNQIMKLDVEDDKPCKQELINLDRLQVVEKGYNFVLDLWHKASCSACFKKDDNGLTIANQTDTTLQLKYYFDLTEACFRDNLNSSSNVTRVCDLCKTEYLTLNTYYNQQKAMCMDIVDHVSMVLTKGFGIWGVAKISGDALGGRVNSKKIWCEHHTTFLILLGVTLKPRQFRLDIGR
ncbi:hypothetical protein WDU94_008958, partial [Cyamophila willieti]